MTCPLFVDYTRHCLEQFPQMVKFSNYDICNSDDYENCLHYIVLNSKSRCKYIDKCADYFTKNTPEIFKSMFNSKKILSTVKEYTISYCLSNENCKNCETYKKFEEGKDPVKYRFPDGKSHFIDILLKKKITIK